MFILNIKASFYESLECSCKLKQINYTLYFNSYYWVYLSLLENNLDNSESSIKLIISQIKKNRHNKNFVYIII